jgi:Tol biopolymer transport system component
LQIVQGDQIWKHLGNESRVAVFSQEIVAALETVAAWCDAVLLMAASGSPRVGFVLFLLVAGPVAASASAAGWPAQATMSTSPEASRLVAFNKEPKGSKGASGPGRLEVWLEKSDGTDKRLLAHGASPLVSPSGRWVAVDTVRGATIYAASGRKQRDFAGTPLAWAPDSDHVALVQPVKSAKWLERLVIASVSSGKQVVAGPPGVYPQVSFSPNGQQLAYAFGQPTPGGFMDIYETGLHGGRPRRLTDSGLAGNPVWGPAGIAFSASAGPAIVPGVIWILNPKTQALRRLTSPPLPTPPGWANTPPGWGTVAPSAWSADGSTLLAQGVGSDTCVAYVVDRTGKETVVGKPTPEAEDMADAISRDGRYALISSGGGICGRGQDSSGPTDLLRVDLRTGGRLTLAVGAWNGSWND